ncbi:MAG: methyl-accepting chemotaxis protein, partial [Pseudomonadota bacterium]
MRYLIPRWFLALSIQWKLQFGFFLVTMITIVVNRWVGYGELEKLIGIAHVNGASAAMIQQLDQRLNAYVAASVWQSGIEFIILFFVISLLAKLFSRPIKNLCRALEGIEQGDLTRVVENHSLDEIGILEHSFNAMLSNLTNIIRNIDDNSKQMAQSAYQVATISHEIAKVSKNEHSRSEEVSSATEQMRNISAAVRQLAEEANSRSVETEKCARAGINTVHRNISEMAVTVNEVDRAAHEMNQLKDASQQIFNILTTIRTIAEQTNLLALNAAIEAARAGEAGRGFAVVADEVRGLAVRTTESTGQISAIIDDLNHRVERVSSAMAGVVNRVNASQEIARATSQAIEGVVQEVVQTAQANQKISSVSVEQMEQFQLLRSSLDRLFETFKESSTKVETTASIGDDLYKVSESMSGLLSQFVYERHAAVEAANHEKRRTPRIERHLRVRVAQQDVLRESICKDMSMTGMQLRLKERLQDGMPLRLDIFLPYDKLSEYER